MTEIRALRAYADVALGRQRSPQHESGLHMTHYLRAANVKDGYLDLSDVKEMNFDPKERSIFGLRPGDILMTEGSGSLGAVGASAVWNGELPGDVCFQNTLLRLRPRPSTSARFLGWWCRHAFADGLFASVASGANIFHLSAERVRSLPMVYLPLSRQRAIADFLDRETARIDTLIAKKRQLASALAARLSAERSHVLWGKPSSEVPLMHMTDPRRQIMYGIVLPGPDLDEGVSIVKGGDVARQFGRPLCKTSPEIEASYARSRLAERDLVFAIRGGVGDVAQVPPEAVGANITQDVARIAPSKHVDSGWLLHALRSAELQRQAEMYTTGATIRGLNIGDLKRLRVPYRSLEEQQRECARLNETARIIDNAAARIRHQLELLREHRQALITAAVTGELDVTGVAA